MYTENYILKCINIFNGRLYNLVEGKAVPVQVMKA